jgi:hypothetical protein
MIIIYKLFIIKQLGIINDILNYITKLWLVEETVVIEPPSLEEWESKKVLHPNPYEYKRDRYILVKDSIVYIEFYSTNDIICTAIYFDSIIYWLNSVSVSVNFHKPIYHNKLYYNKNLFANNCASQIVPFYQFHCNTQID